jgi:hypothetical protein
MASRGTLGTLIGGLLVTGAAVAILQGTRARDDPDETSSASALTCEASSMRIQFSRSGGFAGMTESASVDTDTLPPDERERVCSMVEGAAFFDLPAQISGATPGADRFNYEITVDSDGRSHTVVTDDASAPDSLIPLLDWLRRAARRRP